MIGPDSLRSDMGRLLLDYIRGTTQRGGDFALQASAAR